VTRARGGHGEEGHVLRILSISSLMNWPCDFTLFSLIVSGPDSERFRLTTWFFASVGALFFWSGCVVGAWVGRYTAKRGA